MKTLSKILFISMALIFLSKHVICQDEIKGGWHMEELNNSTIEIYKEDGIYRGKIIKSDESSFIGQIVLKELKFDESENHWKGIIYSPKRFVNIDGTFTIEPDGKLMVVGRKYLMKMTYYWVRIW